MAVRWSCSRESRSLVLDVEKNDDAGDVVDYIFFSLPLLEGRAHQVLSRPFRVALKEIRVHNVGDLLVLEELPDAVTGQYYDLIRGVHAHFGDLGHGMYADFTGDLVAKGATHGEAGDVFMLEPHSFGTHLPPLAVAVRIDTPTCRDDRLRLDRVVRFVVSRQSSRNAFYKRT